MISSKVKTMQPETLKNASELLVNEFYNLRKTFEEDYSGKLRSYKYEETRMFTIALNFAIFQANQLSSENKGVSQKTLDLQGKLQILKTDLKHLKL
jgi:hypothetical protein